MMDRQQQQQQERKLRQQHQMMMQQQQQEQNVTNQFNSVGSITSANRINNNRLVSSLNHGHSVRRQLGNKDLIIRMLAEVFQVNQTIDGQMRWEQVSSSLVPVSLYSRTTSRWLNYMLSASSVANSDSACAMSPDSRDFLLILQQFHQQNRTLAKQTAQAATILGPNNNHNNNNHHHQQQQQQQFADQYENCVVFQVVAHDYIDGQCKKILNVKLAQPGTRLGQASDYFVYWKGQPNLVIQQQQQSQLNSNNNNINYNRRRFVLSNDRQLSSSTPLRSYSFATNQQQQQQITWGLNFASVNDAKLFYDICSLNLVDLDFNSEYLKQFMTQTNDDRNQYQVNNSNYLNVCQQQQQQQQQTAAATAQKVIRNQFSANFNQLIEPKQQQQFATLKSKQLSSSSKLNQEQQSRRQQLMLDEFNSIKCQSCQQSIINSNSNFTNRSANQNVRTSCPIHNNNNSSSSTKQSNQIRTRSRSTTRQPTAAELAAAADIGNLTADEQQMNSMGTKRARSFSTPASPDHLSRDPSCPVHNTDHSQHHLKSGSASSMKRQQQQQQQQQTNFGQSTDSERAAANRQRAKQKQQQQPAPPVPLRQSSAASSGQSLHAKRAPKARYMGHVSQRQSTTTTTNLQQQQQLLLQQQTTSSSQTDGQQQQQQQLLVSSRDSSNKQASGDSSCLDWRNYSSSFGKSPESQRSRQMIESISRSDQETANKFSSSRAAQRRSTACDSTSNIDHSHRNARLARAQYANSKNTKEFLSLDAAGLQLTPTQQQQQPQQIKKRQEIRATGFEQWRETDNPSAQYVSAGAAAAAAAGVATRHGPTEAGMISEATFGADLKLAASRPDCQQTVGTTTEDLPLDAQTRKRMFRLTSEEVISERTEPRSSSTTQTTIAERNHQHQQAAQDRQTARAVSLGPEMGVAGGRRLMPNIKASQASSGGSNPSSRRRSLERTMCVDLDNNNSSSNLGGGGFSIPRQTNDAGPAAASAAAAAGGSLAFRKSYCLSPLQQSSSKSSPSVCGEQPAQSNAEAPSATTTNNKSSGKANSKQSQPSRVRSTPDMSQLPMEICCPGQQQQQQQQQMASLQAPKSGGLSSYAVPLTYCCSGRQDSSELARSTWARQSHSCPNSLRRKRVRNLQPPQLQQQHWQWQQHEIASCGGQSQQPNDCQCQVCPRLQRPNQLLVSRPSSALSQQQAHFCSLCRASDFLEPEVENSDSGGFCWSHSQQQQQQPIACMNNVSAAAAATAAAAAAAAAEPSLVYSESGLPAATTGRASRYCSAGAAGPPATKRQQQQLHQTSAGYYRPCSSLSSRSPLRFGLYESDLEDEEENELEQEQQQQQPHYHHHHHHLPNYKQQQQQQQQESTWPSQRQAACCGSIHADQQLPLADQQQQQQRPASGSHFRPLKPVVGYDQTMARSSLKGGNRQRARSQPPNEPLESDPGGLDSAQAFHLNKSMENVQKLIREVQSELDALAAERWPLLGEMQCSFATKEESDNQRQQQQQPWRPIGGKRQLGQEDTTTQLLAANNNNNSSSSNMKEERKMSRDEEAASLGQQQQQTSGGASKTKVSLSSATRPAGQFKCVGAIRKAGFLSVKKWILKRKQSIELARKQGWKRYWVCLRGTTLLFHSVVERKELSQEEAEGRTNLLTWIQTNCANHQMQDYSANQYLDEQKHPELSSSSSTARVFSRESLAQCYIEKEPRHLIIIEGAIAQPIPEHPKRDFVFCLSTTFGDAYLFQAACQLESDNWIAAVHNACAASIARDLTRDEATKLFENKIRHLEIEAEKKFFLRQRLESRLTSMSSMSHIVALDCQKGSADELGGDEEMDTGIDQATSVKKRTTTMRSLLFKLNQQLLALDSYIEQVHCEIYQLRCYLSSCSSQRLLYKQWNDQLSSSSSAAAAAAATTAKLINNSNSSGGAELPHPKALLMHVSRPTKLILIKLGVFTVSSFHAYIHASQGSAESILQKIQKHSSEQQSPTVELRVRSHTFSEKMFSNRMLENVQLESDTEKLIDMSNLRKICVRLSKSLYRKIKSTIINQSSVPATANEPLFVQSDSDDRFSIHEEGENLLINMRIHPSSNSLIIIKQLLSSIEPNSPEMDFLNYYLRFNVHLMDAADDDEAALAESGKERTKATNNHYIAKRTETINDWSASNLNCLELAEKIVFRLELTRRQIDEEASPFGISIGAQLFEGKLESLLSVYCSYIEWGSVADKATLRDDDELLIINGVPVMDLDMMFIESLIQDDTRLRLVVRSSRAEAPTETSAVSLDFGWRSPPASDNDDANKENEDSYKQRAPNDRLISSSGHTQIISDEYISSLVCPPPPNKSGAFLRTDSTLLRQKSDMSAGTKRSFIRTKLLAEDGCDQANRLSCFDGDDTTRSSMTRAKSQHNIDSSLMVADQTETTGACLAELDIQPEPQHRAAGRTADLAGQLMRKTEQLTRLLGNRAVIVDETQLDGNENEPIVASKKSKDDPNAVERLKKSILELIETEFAYIRHLETISEHYMSPLQEMSYLSIADLKHLNEIVSGLIEFQREFYRKLSAGVSATQNQPIELASAIAATAAAATTTTAFKDNNDEYDELNRIVQNIDSMECLQDFGPLLRSITRTFLDEAEKFKIYSAYCAAYSRLQKLLHPKRSLRVSTTTIIASPNALDSFLVSSGANLSQTVSGGGGGGSSSRDFLKPLGSFMSSNIANSVGQSQIMTDSAIANAHESSKSRLKQLNDFLGHLDSSSSSASLSLPKSSGSNQHKSPSSTVKELATSAHQTSDQASTFQKSAHHQQSFESYLIKPIQRIVKYPMLLNSIALSAQAYANEDVFKDLQSAVKQMESITSHVNDTQRVHDEYGTIFEQIERQFLKQITDMNNQRPAIGPHQPPIGLGIEQLLYFGQIDWLNIGEFSQKARRATNLVHQLFVFNSCVVFICKEPVKLSNKKKLSGLSVGSGSSFVGHSQRLLLANPDSAEIIRYQSLIPVSEVQVRSVPTSSAQTQSRSAHKYHWELFRCSSINSNSSLLTNSNKQSTNDGKVYLLASPTNEARNAFLRKIRFIIRESVRNMSLPLIRPQSSKSMSPKKLSSSSATNTNSSCSQSTSLSPVIHSGEQSGELKSDVLNGRFPGRDDTNYITGIEVNN